MEGNKRWQGMNLRANKKGNKMVTKSQLDVLVCTSGCCGPNACAPNSYVKTITSKVMVLGGRTSGRCLGYEGRALVIGISALIKGKLEGFLAPSTM